PASKYIPEMKGLKYLTTDAPEITVRDLLSHKAGFPEDNPFGDRQLGNTQDQLIQLMKDNPSFSNVPSIQYEYSNLGFALLGTIITNVSGKPYQEYIKENILDPLGMTHTYWEYTKVPSKDLAHGYRWLNNNWEDQELEHDGSWGSMGGIITTIEDFSAYMSYHLDAWPPRNDAETGPVKRSSRREMHMPWTYISLNLHNTLAYGKPCALTGSYGYGLGIVRDCENRLSIGHGGGLPGFGSHWRIMPEYGIGIAIFSNRTYASLSPMTLQILDTLISLSGIKPYQLPASAVLKDKQKALLALLPEWKGAEKTNLFAENFFPDNPIDSLILHATSAYSNAGKIIRISEIIPENNLRGHFDIVGEKKTIRISFTLSPEHDPKIQEYHLMELNPEQK
ncbi:MAG: serine hydrolase domain-containing protein, partial [Chitinophagaceae bacterium]